MSYIRKVGLNRESDRRREESRKRKDAEHQAKVDRHRTPFVGVAHGTPDVGPDPDNWKRKATSKERRPRLLRKMLSKFGSIVTGQWLAAEKQKELVSTQKEKSAYE